MFFVFKQRKIENNNDINENDLNTIDPVYGSGKKNYYYYYYKILILFNN